MTNVVLVLGATSDIGSEIARRLAPGSTIVLAARRLEACTELATELHSLGAVRVEMQYFDALDLGSHATIVEYATSLGSVSHAVVCFGILGDHERALGEPEHAVEIANIDYVAQVSMLLTLAKALRGQTAPARIFAFSSIAGWRARKANFVYGSTKAGLDAFCQGLIDELHGSNVSLILARPGFVIGSMTKGMKPAPMSVTPDFVADRLVNWRGGSATLWIPRRLAGLARVMSVVPRPVWRRMPR